MSEPIPSQSGAASPIPFQSRGWLIFFGVFSIVVGGFAVAFPVIVTIAIEQLIGIVCLVTGIFSVAAVLFGKEKNHRISSLFLAVIRIVAGLALLKWVESGVESITVIVGAFFVLEGVVFLIAGTRYDGKGRFLMILNGVVAIVLGGMIFILFSTASSWVIGLLYGINAALYGISLIALAASAKSPGPA